MSRLFQELGYRQTPIGELSLRARRSLHSDEMIYEIKLGEEYLMSSMFTDSEVALGHLGVREHPQTAAGDAQLHVVVGGLGLGYTAKAVLEHPAVASLTVVEYLQAVIDWHRDGLLPVSRELTADPRCRFVQGDFFAMTASQEGFDPETPGRRFDAILVDIDHTPDLHLDSGNAPFYSPAGLRALARHLAPAGIFGLWSNEATDPAFSARLQEAFTRARGQDVTFFNPLQDRDFTQSVYLAQR